jgi:hypothetical protein
MILLARMVKFSFVVSTPGPIVNYRASCQKLDFLG